MFQSSAIIKKDEYGKQEKCPYCTSTVSSHTTGELAKVPNHRNDSCLFKRYPSLKKYFKEYSLL